ncbi:MAG: serine/threonine protein kinase, partial [Planctomycetes bacterium]|nr:serine/threonine protein kinase [Planctomycetota bacterium]
MDPLPRPDVPPAVRGLDATVQDGSATGATKPRQALPVLVQPALDAVGAAIGQRRFSIAGLLGEGTSGQVYRVVDRDLGRDVAIKVLDSAASPTRVAGFLHEARVAARLEHPNILPIHDIGSTEAGQLWFAMRRVDGQTLAAAIDDTAAGEPPPMMVDLNRRVTVMLQVCNAVRAAHAQSIVHRDIKPANIMLGGFGDVLLLDWGTASSAEPGSGQGRIGTPLYMSPEQARGEEATCASDVYALGATLFHLVVLRP